MHSDPLPSIMESGGSIYEAMSNSMVTVVETNPDKNYEDHCAGCVIFNSVHNTFVLTSSFLVNANSKLTVYFSDKTRRTAKIVSLGKKYCILSVRFVESARAVCFREEEVARESAIILAPVDAYDSQLCSAFVVAPTCKGKDHRLVPVRRSENFFLVKCCFQDQGYHCRSRLNSAPVFDKEGNGIGIVYADVRRSGANVKRIIRAQCVRDLLNKLTSSVNWEEILQGLDPLHHCPDALIACSSILEDGNCAVPSDQVKQHYSNHRE